MLMPFSAQTSTADSLAGHRLKLARAGIRLIGGLNHGVQGHELGPADDDRSNFRLDDDIHLFVVQHAGEHLPNVGVVIGLQNVIRTGDVQHLPTVVEQLHAQP